ncbi:MAG TPA: exodeoxyribonuclease VII large subunit [Firmicutes bacterium]|jgi:exodeoxyribonuclease VII large subunit|nr:exodeoxyribonuclease VII large subunit [Bacillota bacterium]
MGDTPLLCPFLARRQKGNQDLRDGGTRQEFLLWYGIKQAWKRGRGAAVKTEYSVTELTRYLASLITGDPVLQGVWVRGEISNFTRHTSGHMYFTLKDDAARIRAVMFRGQNRTLRFTPENGMLVLAFGSVGVYERNGDYQIYVEMLEPVGQGSLNLAFEQLKEKLGKEGLFAPERKRPLPRLPQKVALITSPTGAAVRDLINILRRRRPNLDILLIPALVQGEEAPESLVAALGTAGQISDLDLVIIGRGGGSLEELWAFNDERVARAIAASSHPVISAVGHETDFTIADFVADLRAPTPSAAAELAVPDQNELTRDVLALRERLSRAARRYQAQKSAELNRLANSVVLTRPERWLNPMRQRLDEAEGRLRRILPRILQERQLVFGNLIGKLNALSPLATLARGYSITRRIADGAFVSDSEMVEIGEEVAVRLARGELICRVEQCKKEAELV